MVPKIVLLPPLNLNTLTRNVCVVFVHKLCLTNLLESLSSRELHATVGIPAEVDLVEGMQLLE